MEKANKEYKVTYKTYYNERLKKSLFHNKLMHPLYVHVTFGRIPIIFKSYYYDLFSKPKYAGRVDGRIHAPDINEIIILEKSLIEFIINKNLESFSLDLFKKEYAFYCRDLLDIMEEGFIDYLYIFFNDKGMPSIAAAINEANRSRVIYDMVTDLKNALNKPLYSELVENSFFYAPPYLPLYSYIQEMKKWPLLTLTVLEWQDDKIKSKFEEHLKTHFDGKNVGEVFTKIHQWVNKK